jgi:predicted DsbA family dithiol-disulfide isomerase
MLFQSQKVWSGKPNADEDFLVMAQKLGLDSAKFMQAMRSQATRERVIADMNRGREMQVEGTPTFFINGRPISPLPQTSQGFRQALQDSLGSNPK